MRTTLRASLLATAAANARTSTGPLAIFETARVYRPGPDTLPDEREHVGGVVTGRRLDRFGSSTEDALDFYDAKAFVASLFERLSLDASYEPVEEFGMLSGRVAELRVGEERLGVLGQMHPDTAASFGLTQDVYVFEIDVATLASLAPSLPSFRSFSRYPAVVEDLALLVDRDSAAAPLLAEIEAHPLVARARIFDEYVGEQVPEGKRSIAVSIAFQTPDRTLTDKDVAKARTKILARLQARLGVELRT